MFRRLRLKLTLINILVVVLITAFFMTGIYGLMIRSMRQSSDQLMRLVAMDAGSNPGNYMRGPRWQKQLPIYFYVKVNNSGDILESSQNVPVSREQLKNLIKESLRQEDDRGIIWQNRDGDHDHYRFLKAPLKNGQGITIVFLNPEAEDRVTGHLLAAFTITGLAGAALTLLGSLFMANRALIPIKTSWGRQKDFVADASHELRTPLTVIQTNLDIVRGSPTDTIESQMHWLDNIKAESEFMTKLIDDLLFLARTDSHQQLMNKDYFPLSSALKEVLTSFEPLASRNEIKITSLIEPQINFNGDQTRIKQLAAILIDNAIKYTPPGGEINLELKDLNNNVEITVSDTGEGIDQEHLDKIFNRFYRVDKARSRDSGGTGLGLSIAEWIVKEHKGVIKVKSSPGKGTTFSLIFPKNRK